MDWNDRLFLFVIDSAEVLDEKVTWQRFLAGVFSLITVTGVLYVADNPDSLNQIHYLNDTEDTDCEDVPTVSGYIHDINNTDRNISQLTHVCNCLNGTIQTRESVKTNTTDYFCEIA